MCSGWVLKVAWANNVAMRVMGELNKLGIKPPSRNTVKKILKAEGLDPGPNRGKGSWDEFLKRHAETLWACDFVSKKVWTKAGLIDFFVLFFIHVGTRRVYIAGFTTSPNSAWMAQQARNLAIHVADVPIKPTMLIRDHDTKFTAEFDGILESDGIEIKKVGPRAPNMNAIAQRWVQSIKQECLEHLVVFGEKHVLHIVSEYVAHHNDERPHQGVENSRLRLIGAKVPPPESAEGEIVCASRLGGLLKHYCISRLPLHPPTLRSKVVRLAGHTNVVQLQSRQPKRRRNDGCVAYQRYTLTLLT